MTESFVITIATEAGDSLARARVDIDGGAVSLAEVQAATGGYEIPGELADVDFGLIVRTVRLLTGTAPEAVPSDTPEADAVPRPPDDTPSRRETFAERDASLPPAVPESMSADDGAEAAIRQSETAAGEGAQPGAAGMPSDFGVNYWRLGSIAKVARHYDVPHRVAKDWIRALQDQRQLASPWPTKQSRPAGRR